MSAAIQSALVRLQRASEIVTKIVCQARCRDLRNSFF